MTASDRLEIHRVASEDLHDLRRRVLRGGSEDAKVVDARDHDDTARHYGAFRGERIVAAGSFYPSVSPRPHEGPSFQLRYLATDFDEQRSGAGSMLLRAAEGDLASEGVSELWANGRDTALGFYDRQGWVRLPGSEHLSPDTQLPHTVIAKTLRSNEDVTCDMATPSDAAALAELREEMYFAMHPKDWSGPWQDACVTYFEETLASGEVLAAVARTSRGEVVASVVVQLRRVVPTPRFPTGFSGYVHTVSTKPAFRRRGVSRQLLIMVSDLAEERGVDRFELHATPRGKPLYASEGYVERTGGAEMRREIRPDLG